MHEDAPEMTVLSRLFRRMLGRAPAAAAGLTVPVEPVVVEAPGVAVDIPETDPRFACLQTSPGPVDLARLELALPALPALTRLNEAISIHHEEPAALAAAGTA